MSLLYRFLFPFVFLTWNKKRIRKWQTRRFTRYINVECVHTEVTNELDNTRKKTKYKNHKSQIGTKTGYIKKGYCSSVLKTKNRSKLPSLTECREDIIGEAVRNKDIDSTTTRWISSLLSLAGKAMLSKPTNAIHRGEYFHLNCGSCWLTLFWRHFPTPIFRTSPNGS